ncbi:MAG TPA: hypothetical protein VFV36_00055, partial [Candidatus Methylomirabilis sp.]|nr:hypothetical protein [Candidatus Methylomirabilis sp.]
SAGFAGRGALAPTSGGTSLQQIGAATLPKLSGGVADTSSARTTVSDAAAPQVAQSPTPAPSPRTLAPQPGAPLDFSQGILQGLTNPIYQGVTAGTQSLTDIGSQFREAAGPSRTFESAGGAQVLQAAIDPRLTGTAEQQAFDAAKALVGADYAGPTDLDQQAYAKLQADLSQVGQQVAGLGTGGGLVSTLQTGTPGITSGMAKYDAQKILENPEYARSVISAQDAYQALAGKAGQERTAAQEFAKQRDQEEAAIAEASKGFLEGRRQETYGGLDQRVAAANAEQDRIADIYSRFMGTGDISSFYGQEVPMSLAELAPFIDNPAMQGTQAAQDAYWQVANKPEYAAIKNMPPLELTVGDRGREKYSLAGDDSDEELWDSVKKGTITREAFELLKRRQAEWEAAGLSPGSAKTEAGQFSSVAPL